MWDDIADSREEVENLKVRATPIREILALMLIAPWAAHRLIPDYGFVEVPNERHRNRRPRPPWAGTSPWTRSSRNITTATTRV